MNNWNNHNQQQYNNHTRYPSNYFNQNNPSSGQMPTFNHQYPMNPMPHQHFNHPYPPLQPQPTMFHSNSMPQFFNTPPPNFPFHHNQQQFMQAQSCYSSQPINNYQNNNATYHNNAQFNSFAQNNHKQNNYSNNRNHELTNNNNNKRYERRYDSDHKRNLKRSRSSSKERHHHRSNSYHNNRTRKSNNDKQVKYKRRDESTSKASRNKSSSESETSSSNEDEIEQQQVNYSIQMTQIPVYYSKDETNPKIFKSTGRLDELCGKFDSSVVQRSKKIREKQNISSELTKIPDYRQLLMTNKFDKFTRCKCDHNNTESKSSCTHSHHRKTRSSRLPKKKLNDSMKSSSSSSSSRSSSSFSSTSCSSRTSSRSSDYSTSSTNSSNASKKSKKNSKKNNEDDEEFEDIRSMEIDRKLKHPERLHSELSFNEPDQTNEGPLCKCKLKNTTFGTRHQIYYGEQPIPLCNQNSNNLDKLFHYRMSISPFKNFIFKDPTTIEYDSQTYTFEGFSIFSHEPLEKIPDCVVVIYNNEYKLNIVKEEMIENFTVKELELLKDYIFVEILELYDLKWRGFNISDESCNRFHVMPRFCRNLPYNGKELLSPSEIIKYFLSENKPVVTQQVLNECKQMSNREWLNYVEPMQGSIVTCPGKRPASIRLDQLDRDLLLNESSSSSSSNKMYPLIIHFSMFRNTWLPLIKNNLKLKKLYHKYFKLRHLLNNKTKLTTEDRNKLRALGDELQAMMRKASDVSKEIMIELSSENFYRTGIRTDIVQHAVLVPTFIEHIRFHLSLKFLEEKINYKFNNRLLLQYALTHPSGAFLHHQNLGSNPDHVRNALFNCKVRNPNYGFLTPQKRKSLLRKKGIHMLFSIMAQKAHDAEQSSQISNYERLEFLGDKILELLTSRHLFLLFPMFDEGQLSEYRNAIVQNQYLAVLARRLDMHYFIIFYHGVDLCSNSALNHALANSFEALLAAIYLDSDLTTVSNVLSKTLWDTEETQDLYNVWTHLPPHPIQAQLPQGDRHLIKTTKILQHVNIFEDLIGVEFKHIRLLAQAFCTRSASFNLITLGDNQRLEFLGDTVLNFVVSEYLYKHFPNHHEGHLSLLRSSLVCNSTQALLYDELGMSDFVLTSYINNRQETSCNLKRKADVFEAFVGALYLDQGLEAVSVFCSVCMFNKLQDIILYQFWNDPKSRLQQCCLSLRDVDDSKPSLPTYRLIEERGPPNHKQYRVAVYFNRKRIGEGMGKSIHDAEVEAAKNALKTKADMFPILTKYGKNMEMMKSNLKNLTSKSFDLK